MYEVELIGGSFDGMRMKVKASRPMLRLPPREGGAWSEVYERQGDGRYVFVRHGVPPLTALPEAEEARADAELREIVGKLMPLLQEMDEHFRQRGGYTELALGMWNVVRRDDVPVG